MNGLQASLISALALVTAACAGSSDSLNDIKTVAGNTPFVVAVRTANGATLGVHFDFDLTERAFDFSLHDISCQISTGAELVYGDEHRAIDSPFGKITPIGEFTLPAGQISIECVDFVDRALPLRLTVPNSAEVEWELEG